MNGSIVSKLCVGGKWIEEIIETMKMNYTVCNVLGIYQVTTFANDQYMLLFF